MAGARRRGGGAAGLLGTEAARVNMRLRHDMQRYHARATGAARRPRSAEARWRRSSGRSSRRAPWAGARAAGRGAAAPGGPGGPAARRRRRRREACQLRTAAGRARSARPPPPRLRPPHQTAARCAPCSGCALAAARHGAVRRPSAPTSGPSHAPRSVCSFSVGLPEPMKILLLPDFSGEPTRHSTSRRSFRPSGRVRAPRWRWRWVRVAGCS